MRAYVSEGTHKSFYFRSKQIIYTYVFSKKLIALLKVNMLPAPVDKISPTSLV